MYIFAINTSTLIIKKISMFSKNNSKLFEIIFQKYFNIIYNHYSKNERI